jgi:hypothetical protein
MTSDNNEDCFGSIVRGLHGQNRFEGWKSLEPNPDWVRQQRCQKEDSPDKELSH